MNDIQLANVEKGDFVVNTREIYNALVNLGELSEGTQYRVWIKAKINNFKWEENKDYESRLLKSPLSSTGQSEKIYFITKEASLLLRQKTSPDGLEIQKKANNFTISMAEALKHPRKLAEILIAYDDELERERALREKAENSLTQLTAQQNYHNSQLTTFTQAYNLVKTELAKKYNIKEYKVKFKRETIINLLLSESWIIREGKRLKLVATDKGLEKGYIDNKIDTSIEGKAFKTPALTSEGVKYILKEFVEDN